MDNKDKGAVSKGFIMTLSVIVLIAGSLIFYMRSNMYLPEDVRNMMEMVESGDTGEMITRFEQDIIHQRRAGIADLLSAAEKGDIKAQRKLARLYRSDRNENKAFEWIKKAADTGDAGAINDLAYYYECGIGTEKDTKKAIELYTPGAEAGDVMSQYALAGIETDKKKAEYWMSKVHEAMKSCQGCDLPSGGCT